VRRALAAVVLSLSILLPSVAQQPAPASPQPGQLLQGALAALSANVTVTDITLSGTVHYIAGSDDETGTATLKALSSGAARIDLVLPSGQRSEVRNGAAGSQTGTWSGPDLVSHPIAFQNLVAEPAWFFPAFLVLRGASPSGYVATYVGHDTVDNQAVEHLAISQAFVEQLPAGVPTIAQLSQTDLLVDSATFLPAAMSFNVHADSNALVDIPITVRFSDYRQVNGVQIPFHIQKFLNNGLVLDVQLQNATVNSGLSATDFAVPAVQQ
jgi:hypothetical protein